MTEIILHHGGRYLVRGGTVHSSSGGWEPKRVVVIIFEKIENLLACYASPAYQAIVLLRQQSSNSKAVVVEGWPQTI